MIDFQQIAQRLNKKGMMVDMIAEVAVVDRVLAIDNDKLIVVVTPLRNLGEQKADVHVWDQKRAAKFGVERWKEAEAEEVYELLKKLGKTAHVVFLWARTKNKCAGGVQKPSRKDVIVNIGDDNESQCRKDRRDKRLA